MVLVNDPLFSREVVGQYELKSLKQQSISAKQVSDSCHKGGRKTVGREIRQNVQFGMTILISQNVRYF